MTAVSRPEVKPGLSVRLDTTQLRQLGGSDTNASPGPPDRAVQGPHQFLIVEIDANDRCLAVPLFSNPAKGNNPLLQALKSGTLPAWVNGNYHYSVFQHWWIPADHVVAASGTEISVAGNRSMYAEAAPQELADISAAMRFNKFGFRRL